jgi:hypothetical protein
MRSDSPRVAAASEARRSSSLSSSSKRVSLEAEGAYDSPTLLPRRSLVFPSHLVHTSDTKAEQPVQEEDFSSSKSSSGEYAMSAIFFPCISITLMSQPYTNA